MALELLLTSEAAEKIGSEELIILSQVFARHFRLPDSVVEIELVTLPEIQALNKEYRNLDEPTDVLSFPTFANLEEVKIYPGTHPVLGSIIIAPEKAALYNETLLQLVHHGLLHILGYDHETDLNEWHKAEQAVLSELAHSNLSVAGIVDATL